MWPERPECERRDAAPPFQLTVRSSESFNVKSVGMAQYDGFGLHQTNEGFDVSFSDGQIGRGQTTGYLHAFDAHGNPSV